MVSEFISAFIIAVVQGLTEWLPVSSSGHLILAERVLDFPISVGFNVALHFGTLLAVLVYFWKDIIFIVRDFVLGKWNSENGKLGWFLVFATIPSVIVGPLIKDGLEIVFQSLSVLAFGFGITGILLLLVSVKKNDKHKELGFWKSFFIGVSQVFAVIPGVSRSGATISSGIFLGLDEKKAMRFSFLMAIPVIFGANILYSAENFNLSSLWAVAVSFFAGILVIHLLFRYVLANRRNFVWFGIYCLLLAFVLGVWTFV